MGILGDFRKIRDVILGKIILGDVEDLFQVHNLANCVNASKRIVGSLVFFEGIDE